MYNDAKKLSEDDQKHDKKAFGCGAELRPSSWKVQG